MLRNILFSVLLVGLFSFQGSNGNVLDSIHQWYQDNVSSHWTTRDIVGEPGHWNKLLKYGLGGRVAHFFLTDSNGFGREIKNLGAFFKNEFEENRYTALEDRVVASISVLDVLYESSLVLFRIRNVRDSKTGKTLGYAIDILKSLAKDPEVVDEFVKRWNMVTDLQGLSENQPKAFVNEEQRKQMKLLLLENPKYFSELFLDPEVMSRVSSYILQSLKNVDLIKVFESIQQLTLLLKSTYPDQFEQVAQELYGIKDDETGLSFADSLITIYNIMQQPQFKATLDSLLTNENLRKMHETTQEIIPNLIKGQSSVNPESLRNTLQNFGIVISREKAEEILNMARSGTLIDKIYQFIEEVDQMSGGFTPQNISTALEVRNVRLTSDQVKNIMVMLQAFPAEDVPAFMATMGVDVDVDQIRLLQEKCAAYVSLVPPTEENMQTD